MRISRFDHLVLTVADVDRSLAWYGQVLGMEPITFAGGRRALALGEQKINLHQQGAEVRPHANHPTPGSADLCLVSARPLTEVAAHLASQGVTFEEGPVARTGATGPITSLYLRDPDGNLLEISTYDSGRPRAPWPYDLLAPVPSFTLTSTDFSDGDPLPPDQVHSGDGHPGLSPQLSWEGAPPETRGYAVTCFDPDAPTGSGFWHWLLLGLPADCNALPAGAGVDHHPALPPGAYHTRSDFGGAGFGGAAPPAGDPAHRYIFAVHALDTDQLRLDPATPAGGVGFNLVAHTIGRATLYGLHAN